jgi:hypothetical protein
MVLLLKYQWFSDLFEELKNSKVSVSVPLIMEIQFYFIHVGTIGKTASPLQVSSKKVPMQKNSTYRIPILQTNEDVHNRIHSKNV